MARRKKDAPIDLADSHELSFGLIDALVCPPGKMQAFLRDKKTPGLRVRVTAARAKSYVFEGKLNRQTIRQTIGDVRAWTIEGAQQEANRLRVLLDSGTDPRELERDKRAAKAAMEAEAASRTVTVADVWPRYMAEGKPKRRSAWKPRYIADLNKAASLGGEPKKRGKGMTKPGHLAALMPLTLASIDQDVIREWYAYEGKTAPIQAARAVAMFSGFLGWCATKKDLRALVNKNAARASELGDVLPGVNKRRDALEIDQLPAWFSGTDKLRTRTAAAYLQALVLTGARREELAGLTWANVDFRWQKLTIADKVEATRVIPLTPYMAMLLAGLPRVNAFVFSSTMSASGRIAEPRAPHTDVLADAGIPHVSIHGLRRTFSLLGEAAGAPAGAIAQVMGHKPSAIAEGYRPRSIDALRPYLALIERFILDKAGIAFDATKAAPGGLRVVA
ncbi:tyrosine-type recombinase/integrase [Methylibium sp.]|uniref:tyrosine-type recombinase/integrase n=1 Tax=Methylibium sp. TaxID=2067992 RepID=UPI00286A57C3|nr:tyrosine-type recombinase/integrase [Methylibium sp.]